MRSKPFRVLWNLLAVATTTVVASCGGNTTTVPLSAPPLVTASLSGFRAAGASSGQTNNATVAVMDTSKGMTPIPVAWVDINGVSLPYSGEEGRYEGHVTVNPGDTVTLTVQIGALSYKATATQFLTYPVLTTPQSAQTISSFQTLSIAWQGSSPAPDDGYQVSVLDARQPNAEPVWPLGDGLSLPGTATSYEVPGLTITAGPRLVQVGAVRHVIVAGAASGSTFALGAYDIAPLTVSGLPVTHQVSATQQTLNGIASSSAQFVAVGDAGTIVTSPDGSTWTAQVSANSNALHGVVWSRSQWLAVGENGTILTSPDGIRWTIQNSGTNTPLYSATDSGSEYIAVGLTGAIYTSPDGMTWTSQASGTQDVLHGVACSPVRCVVVGRAGTILSSEDGHTWTQRVLPAQPSGYEAVIWAGGQFVAVGYSDTPCCSDMFATSGDGVSWTLTASNTDTSPSAVAYLGSSYLTVGGSGVEGTMLSSTDAVTWIPQATGSPVPLLGVASSGSVFAAVGVGGAIYTSP